MSGKFNVKTATKTECLIEANRLLDLGIRAEASGKGDTLIDRSIKMAVLAENAAFDGRS